MATIRTNIDTRLDVLAKQRQLTEESLGQDSVYIKLKETLKEMQDNGTFREEDGDKVVAETLANYAQALMGQSMTTALQWAAQEKELEIKNKELEYQLGLLDAQTRKMDNDVEGSLADLQLKQAQLIRDYGTAVKDANGNVVELGTNGRLYTEEQNVKQDTANKKELNKQINSQTQEVQARTHRTVADTYVNHGIYTWTDISDTGITGVAKTATGYVTLSDLNKEVAKEQAKGYVYNAWANAATASGGMIGTLIGAEIPGLDPTSYLNTWNTTVSKLKNLNTPSISI